MWTFLQRGQTEMVQNLLAIFDLNIRIINQVKLNKNFWTCCRLGVLLSLGNKKGHRGVATSEAKGYISTRFHGEKLTSCFFKVQVIIFGLYCTKFIKLLGETRWSLLRIGRNSSGCTARHFFIISPLPTLH